MKNLVLKPRTLEHVKTFWEKSRDQEIERMFPFNKGTLNDAIKLYEESLKPDSKSFGKVINIDNKYIGDVWCYGIDETFEKQAFVSIIIFDKTYWGKGIGKDALKQFSNLVFERYAVSSYVHSHIKKISALLLPWKVQDLKNLKSLKKMV